MSLSLADFRLRFGEFADVSDALVQARLSEAESQLDGDVFGSSMDDAHGSLTAHLLTVGGYGREVPTDGETSYSRRHTRVARRRGGAKGIVID